MPKFCGEGEGAALFWPHPAAANRTENTKKNKTNVIPRT
jgi:hypothetical protein